MELEAAKRAAQLETERFIAEEKRKRLEAQ